MCNQQVTDVMNFAEYIPNPLCVTHHIRPDILSELVNLCKLFKIDRSLWNVEKIAPNGGFTLSAKDNLHCVTVSFGKNKIIFDVYYFNGYDTNCVEFSTTDHDPDFFAAILAMLLAESEAEIAHITHVEALQAL